MQLFDRLKMGAVLTKDSLLLMRHHPKLMLFPIVSGAAGIAFLGIFLGVTFGLARISPEVGVLAGLLLIYLALTFVSTFFTAALVHQTRSVLAGGDVSITAGVAAAWDRKTPISLLGIQLVSIAIVLPFALVGIYLFTLGVTTIGIGLVLVGVLSSFLVSQTLGGVVKTTLYLYAVEGTKPEEFDDVDFDRLNENGDMRPPRATTTA